MKTTAWVLLLAAAAWGQQVAVPQGGSLGPSSRLSDAATLSADKVDGSHSSATPGANTVPVADGNGKLAPGWMPLPTSSSLGGIFMDADCLAGNHVSGIDVASGRLECSPDAADWPTITGKPATFPPDMADAGMLAALALKAPLADPSFTGVVNAVDVVASTSVQVGAGTADVELSWLGTGDSDPAGACAAGQEIVKAVSGDSTKRFFCNAGTWAEDVPASSALSDPGANGVVKRTGLNATAVATGADILALWNASAARSDILSKWTACTSGYLKQDGSCSTPTAGDVGLGNVDNTSDVNKPVSTAQQTALDAKAPLASPTFTGTVGGVTAAMVGLGNVDNTSDANKPVSTAQQAALDLKEPVAPVWHRQGIIIGGAADTSPTIYEPFGLYEGNCTLLANNPPACFKLYYSCYNTSNGICLAESLDAKHWTFYGGTSTNYPYGLKLPGTDNHAHASILHVGGTYYMLASNAGNQDDLLTSADGITWALSATNVLPISTDPTNWNYSGGFEFNTSMIVDGAQWDVLYDGANRTGGPAQGNYAVGGATSTDNGATWTNCGSDPLIIGSPAGCSAPALKKVGGTYYAWVTCVASANTSGDPENGYPTDIYRYSAQNFCGPWTANPTTPTLTRDTLDEGAIWAPSSEIDFVGNPEIIEAAVPSGNTTKTQTYLFYSALDPSQQANGKAGRVKVAIADMPLSQLVQTKEGAVPDREVEAVSNLGDYYAPKAAVTVGTVSAYLDGTTAKQLVVGTPPANGDPNTVSTFACDTSHLGCFSLKDTRTNGHTFWFHPGALAVIGQLGIYDNTAAKYLMLFDPSTHNLLSPWAVGSDGSIHSGSNYYGSQKAGQFYMVQGPAPTFPANSFSFFADPTISTSFGWKMPSAENAEAGIVHVGAASGHASAVTVGPITGADLPKPTTSALGGVYSDADCPAGESFNGIDTATGKLKCTAITPSAIGLGNVSNVAQMPLSYLDTDPTLTANSDAQVASQKATKAYVDATTAPPCESAAKYAITGNDWATRINAALVAATATGASHCVDARMEKGTSNNGVFYLNSNMFAGITASFTLYLPNGILYTSKQQATPDIPHKVHGASGAASWAATNTAHKGTIIQACNSAGPNGCGTNPYGFADFAGTVTPSTGLTNTGRALDGKTAPNVIWREGGSAGGTRCFSCTLDNVMIDANGVTDSIPYYSFTVEEGSGVEWDKFQNYTLACAVFDHGDNAVGAGHYHWLSTDCSSGQQGGAGTYGVVIYGGTSADGATVGASGPAYFIGGTFAGQNTPVAHHPDQAAIHIDGITTTTVQNLHFEWMDNCDIEVGEFYVTKGVQAMVVDSTNNGGAQKLVCFDANADSSNNAMDLYTTGTAVYDANLSKTVTGNVNFWTAGVGSVPALISISGLTCDATKAGQFNYVQGNSSTKDIVQVCAHDASNVYAWRAIY